MTPKKKTLAQLIKTGKFAWVNSDINATNFPAIGKNRGGLELFRIDKPMTTREIEAEMKRQGLEPANLRELLTYSKNDWDDKTTIFSLGSSWLSGPSFRSFPYLYGGVGLRLLNLYWGYPVVRWSEGYRFLASRKSGPLTLAPSALGVGTWTLGDFKITIEKL
jgi:hypothetical protein